MHQARRCKAGTDPRSARSSRGYNNIENGSTSLSLTEALASSHWPRLGIGHRHHISHGGVGWGIFDMAKASFVCESPPWLGTLFTGNIENVVGKYFDHMQCLDELNRDLTHRSGHVLPLDYVRGGSRNQLWSHTTQKPSLSSNCSKNCSNKQTGCHMQQN